MKEHALAPAERLVLVAWWDASTASSWASPPFEPDIAPSLSVGWLLAETEDAIVVGATAGRDRTFGDRTSIPRSDVAWIRPLLTVDPE